MTGSFTNMLLSLQLLAGWVSGDEDFLEELKRLPELGKARMEKADRARPSEAIAASTITFIWGKAAITAWPWRACSS